MLMMVENDVAKGEQFYKYYRKLGLKPENA